MRELLLGFESSALLLSGDFNTKLSKFDTDSDTFRCTRASNKLQDLLSEFGLEDTWRFKHPAVRSYTGRRSNPLQQSRIDYIFASSSLIENNVADVRIDTGILSDHSLVYIDIQLSPERRGPGIWRYNNMLLSDESHVDVVREEISNALRNSGTYYGIVNKGLKVGLLLSSIRVITVKKSKQVAHDLRRAENRLYSRANELENIVAKSPSNDVLKEYEKVKAELELS